MTKQPGRSIKSHKPRMGKSSRYKQGYFDVSKSLKYLNSSEPCIYRSSLEFKFMKWCELSDRVKNWESEPFSVKYTCLETGKERNYWIDFSVITSNNETWLIEVKSSKDVQDVELFQTLYNRLSEVEKKRLINSRKVAAKNYSKWKHARQICNDRNWKFVIVTERWLNKTK